MTSQEALKVLSDATANLTLNRPTHMHIIHALELINAAITPLNVAPKPSTEDPNQN